MKGFTLLWEKILRSSIWINESKETRLVWITLLALRDEEGKICCSLVGLADAAKVSKQECQAALEILLSRDPDDTSGVEEGRRLRMMDGGWQIVNHDLYRFSTEAKREFWKTHQAEYRAKKVEKPRHGPPANDTGHSGNESKPKKEDTYSPESRVALHFLNERSGRKFRETETSLAPINARLKESGVDILGVKQMISRQCSMWKDTRMQEYLTPTTLFGPEKFNNYYAAKDLPINLEERGAPQKNQSLLND